ncbi:hypothetical protein [Streptomyces sp. NBC_01446]|uniref:Uncharacterized protein n=1 Tax=Streptomyces sp. NBC_00119 TaxID=2975659 RepID=A0AAU1U089_9ACTN|nr:hypothetical protein [Streptomyces sp. NBC_01446]MCX4648365.1 hypothetical protein [Streptomyces sp. NBC_01446]
MLDEHIVAVHDNGFIPEGSPVEGWEESTGHSGLIPTSPTLVGEDRQVGASALPRPDGAGPARTDQAEAVSAV